MPKKCGRDKQKKYKTVSLSPIFSLFLSFSPIIFLENFLRICIATEILMPKEVLLHFFTHIIMFQQLFQKLQKGQQLAILIEMIVRQDRNAVFWLQHKRKARIIYKNTILQTPINTSEVLCVEPLFQSTMLPIESMGEELSVWIEIVQDHVCIGCTACSKNDDFCEGGKLFQKLRAVRTHTNACLCFSNSTEMMEPPSTGKSSLTVQLLDISSQWISVQSKSRQTVFSFGFFFVNLMSLGTAGFIVFPMRKAQIVCRKCCLANATKYPFSLASAALAMRAVQQALGRREDALVIELFLFSGLSCSLRLSNGNFRSCLTFLLCSLSPQLSSFPLPSNFSSVKLLLDLILSSIREGVSFARQAPIRLSKEEPTLRSQVLSLKEYLYFGAETVSI